MLILKVRTNNKKEYLEFSNEEELKKYINNYIDYITFKNNDYFYRDENISLLLYMPIIKIKEKTQFRVITI